MDVVCKLGLCVGLGEEEKGKDPLSIISWLYTAVVRSTSCPAVPRFIWFSSLTARQPNSMNIGSLKGSFYSGPPPRTLNRGVIKPPFCATEAPQETTGESALLAMSPLWIRSSCCRSPRRRRCKSPGEGRIPRVGGLRSRARFPAARCSWGVEGKGDIRWAVFRPGSEDG